jgi:hypothetical protein
VKIARMTNIMFALLAAAYLTEAVFERTKDPAASQAAKIKMRAPSGAVELTVSLRSIARYPAAKTVTPAPVLMFAAIEQTGAEIRYEQDHELTQTFVERGTALEELALKYMEDQ